MRAYHEDQQLEIDDTPENVAKALFSVNPNEEDFEWEYLKQSNAKGDARTGDAVQ